MSSTTSKSNNNTNDSANSISETEDMKMFQAARRTGRRNACGDMAEQFSQVTASKTTSDVETMTPHFQAMSIKH